MRAPESAITEDTLSPDPAGVPNHDDPPSDAPNAGEKEQSAPSPTRKSPRFPIVGIGASAGGLAALVALIKHVPHDSGLVYIVVTHYPRDQRSMLPDLLAREANVQVVPIQAGQTIEPDTVYVAPPDHYVALDNGHFQLTPLETGRRIRLPIDHLFRSLAERRNEVAIGVILSGSGSDGTQGARAIQSNGGYVIAQVPSTAEYADMPSSVIDVGAADLVLPPEEIAAQLVAIASRLPQLPDGKQARPTELPGVYRQILQRLRDRTGHDFLAYKPSTLRRRIDRRLHLHLIDDPEHYLRLLDERAHEVDLLFRELLIGVTSFFRDPDAFQALEQALAKSVELRQDPSEFRAWVPACSTGEEAFSVAILLREVIDRVGRPLSFQVFGTDIDARAIARARSASYPTGIIAEVGEERMRHNFVCDDSGCRVHKHLRDSVIFAQQNIIKDPPFVRLDLLCCRNLLIYMKHELQRQLVPLFHYALRPGGLLFLGPSEGVAGLEDLFEPVNKRWKLFRRRDVPTPHRRLPFTAMQQRREARDVPEVQTVRQEEQLVHVVERALLKILVPPTVVVDSKGDIVFVHGRTGDFLEPASGRPLLNLVEMARPGLGGDLGAVLRQAQRQVESVVRRGIRLSGTRPEFTVTLSAKRIDSPETLRGLVAITFRTVHLPEDHGGATTPDESGESGSEAHTARERELQEQLRYTKESLQSAIEEMETSNEELKSANEELQSANEELQSVNEELETSKEETQSLNEELHSVNVELQDKVDELARANDDMQNLLDNTDVAAIFLDRSLRIKRYTEKATKLVNLIPTDIGRPLSDLTVSLVYDKLADDVKRVLHTLETIETEVADSSGELYLMRIRPYRTASGAVEGVAISIIDIRAGGTEYVWRHVVLPMFDASVAAAHEPTLVMDGNQRILVVNEALLKLFGMQASAEASVGCEWTALEDRRLDVEPLRRLLQVNPLSPRSEEEIDAEFPEIGRRRVHVRAEAIRPLPGERYVQIVTFQDRMPPS